MGLITSKEVHVFGRLWIGCVYAFASTILSVNKGAYTGHIQITIICIYAILNQEAQNRKELVSQMEKAAEVSQTMNWDATWQSVK